jgi:ATP-binding cassette, subfamily B, bacterial MsbA
MNRSPFRRFLSLCRPHAVQISFGVALILVATFLTLPAPWILKIIIDKALPNKDVGLLMKLLGLFTALFMLRAWLTMVRNRVLQHAAMRLVCDLRIQLFAHLQTLSLRYFDRTHTGETVSRVSQDTGEVYTLTNGFLINLIADSVTVVVVVGFLFYVDWRLALATSAVMPLFVFNYLYNRRRMREESRTHRQNWDRVMGFLHEKVSSARVIKSFVREQGEITTFSGGINADFFNYSRIVMRNTKLAVIADLLGSIGALVVLGYGGLLVVRGQMGVGTLVAFNAYIAFVFPPIVRFVDLATIFQRAITALENVFALLDTKPEVADMPGAATLPPIRGEVEFRNVSFDYNMEATAPGEPRTLRDVSFRIREGQVAAIVGPSGSGKSTIINLLARFYDPASGQVLVDGQDIRFATSESFRQQIGIVLQENVLFSGTLEDNLKYGKPDATREEIIAAATTANAHDFIVALPDGYSTVVGERGAQMSGGQRQRIAIARAILKNPRILIFDEATSALDLASERLIQQAMERVMQGRTTFIIAHRLSTIQRADQILVMDQGRLAERGTHVELLALEGLYARLHALQFKDTD